MKTKTFKIIITFLISLNMYASIDVRDDFQLAVEENALSKKLEQNRPATQFNVDPVYLNRDINVITLFSRLPENILLNMEQYLLHYETDKKLQVESAGTKTNDDYTLWLHFCQRVLNGPYVLETFLRTTNYADISDTSDAQTFTIGAKGQTQLFNMFWNGEVSYEDLLASNVASPAVKAALSGAYHFASALKSSLKLALEYSDESFLEETLSTRIPVEKSKGNIFAPTFCNMSVLNLSYFCQPVNKMFMSMEYYYYLQNHLQKQSFANSLSSFAFLTTGESRDLGHELDIRAIFTHNPNWKSGFAAEWFEPGKAYANTDETKTFEIRGEIVINF